MTKLTKLDRGACHVLREAINEALSSIDFENRYGVDINVGTMSYANTGAGPISTKLEIALLNADGKAETQQRIDFKKRANWFAGLAPTDLDREFTDFDGTRFKIVGLKPKSRKYPIVVEDMENGKLFKFPAKRVSGALDRQKEGASK